MKTGTFIEQTDKGFSYVFAFYNGQYIGGSLKVCWNQREVEGAIKKANAKLEELLNDSSQLCT